MSWFDTTGFTSFAKSALNTAQKTIDKALDIKDDIAPSDSTIDPTDVDSFFEAFGLTSVAPPQVKASPPQPPIQTESSTSSRSQSNNSGFWTDTWGSFFEGNKSLSEVHKESDKSTPKITSSPQKAEVSQRGSSGEAAVSSQPLRSSLFPGSVEVSSSIQPVLEHAAADLSGVTTLPVTETTVQSKLNYSSPDITTENLNFQQDFNASESQEGLSSPCSVSSNKNQVTQEVSSENCTNEINSESLTSKKVEVSSEHDKCPEEKSVVDKIPSCDVQKCKQLLGEENFKYVQAEYDVIDLSEKCLEGTFEKNLVDSSSSSDDCQRVRTISGSTDLCCTVQGSYINLEKKNVMIAEYGDKTDDQKSSNDVPYVQCDTENVMTLNESFQILNPCVRHTVNDWVNSENIHQLEDSVHDSESTEEANSRNGDTQSNSSKDESETDVKECEVKSSGSGGSQEMSGSFVKCSMEETDYGSHRGQSPLSTTTSERSDGTKLESEQNTSGDEIETTTSSDIEILSTPSGENGDRSSSHSWVPRVLRIRRSESPSSDCGKDCLMPVVQEGEEFKSPSDANESKADHRKIFEGMDIKKLFQHQEELQILLEAREKKILELSQENVKLRENEEKLQIQLKEVKAAETKNSQIISAMTKECTQRLAQMEGQLLKVSKERDQLRSQLDDAESEMVQRIRVTEMDDIMKEKEQQIKELMEEGEKLSKKELTHTTIIKKLRAKEEDMEHTNKSLKEKLDENSKEVDRLRKSLGAKDEQEKKHIDAIRQLTATTTKQEKEISRLKSNLEDYKEKELSLKKSLEGTYMELTELRKSNERKSAEIEKLTLSVEMAAKEKLREGLDQANKEASREKEALLMQMEDLRNSLKRNEEDANLREKSLKEDIARLQMRLQESEDRNEKLTKNMSTATRPVVRQIEILQASYNAQIASSEKIERNLTDRLSDVQSQLALCTEKERLANEKYLEMSSKYTKLESENASLRQAKVKLNSEVDMLNSRLSQLEEITERESLSVNNLKQNFTSEINRLQDEKDKLSQELQRTLEQLKEERLRVQNLHEEIKLKEYKLQSIGNFSRNSSPNASLRSSVDSVNNWIHEEVPDRRVSTPVNNYRMSVYDSLRTGCAASVLENLQSQLKQREGEIAQLQCEITKLERERESMAQELVNMTTQNEDLQQNLENLIDVEKNYKELDLKYNTLLQMYGETVEKNEELKLDLAEVKNIFQAQIEELLQK